MTRGELRAVPVASPDARTRWARAAARVLVAVVFACNLHCALQFLFVPGNYEVGFEFTGVPGEVALRGLGILFLMWNVTYVPALIDPWRHRAFLIVVIVQQLVGLVGETWIRASVPPGHEVLAGSIERFVVFDAAGLALLVCGAVLVWTIGRGEGSQGSR